MGNDGGGGGFSGLEVSDLGEGELVVFGELAEGDAEGVNGAFETLE